MRKIIIFLLALLLCGCQGAAQPEPEVVPEEIIDYSEFFGRKMKVIDDSDLFVFDGDKMTACGTALKNSLWNVDSQQGNYLHIADSLFYIRGEAVEKSDRYYPNRNHLLPWNQNVVTNETYEIQDLKGRVVMSINSSDEYPLFVLDSEDDARYGVEINNMLYYIPKDQAILKDADNGTSAVASDLPVMMYHFFYDASAGESRIDGNYVEVNEFEQQLDYLNDNKYTGLTMQETLYFLTERSQIPVHSYVITIDDADPSVHQYAYPILKEHEINATLFVICGWQEPDMPWELWEMREAGIELQSHSFLMHEYGCEGMGHGGRLLCVAHDEGVEDTKASYAYCDGGFVYCYPFGDVNDNARQIIIDAGTKMAFTTEPGKVRPGMDLFTLPRVRVHGGNSLDAYISALN
ncbi:MAG: polysaccharide deacetylase family protein [Erysipelotrichaceae bacterium]|nr:polysaccharide deacetylase family protein [Erysipelotrichaceae bacterium]